MLKPSSNMFKCFNLGQAQLKDNNFHCYSSVQFTPVMEFFGVTVHDCAVCRVGQLVGSSTSELLERIELIHFVEVKQCSTGTRSSRQSFQSFKSKS